MLNGAFEVMVAPRGHGIAVGDRVATDKYQMLRRAFPGEHGFGEAAVVDGQTITVVFDGGRG